jgi:hypothetical protein
LNGTFMYGTFMYGTFMYCTLRYDMTGFKTVPSLSLSTARARIAQRLVRPVRHRYVATR